MVYRITEATRIEDSGKEFLQDGSMPEPNHHKAEKQCFEASEVDTYKCEICGHYGRTIWTILSPIDYHGEVGGWEVRCNVCREPATMLND